MIRVSSLYSEYKIQVYIIMSYQFIFRICSRYVIMLFKKKIYEELLFSFYSRSDLIWYSNSLGQLRHWIEILLRIFKCAEDPRISSQRGQNSKQPSIVTNCTLGLEHLIPNHFYYRLIVNGIILLEKGSLFFTVIMLFLYF